MNDNLSIIDNENQSVFNESFYMKNPDNILNVTKKNNPFSKTFLQKKLIVKKDIPDIKF
jgi:hypothetical protein